MKEHVQQKNTKPTKLEDFIAAARNAGAEVSISLVPKGKKSLSQRVQDLESAAMEVLQLYGELWATCRINLDRGTLTTKDDKFFRDYLASRHKEFRRLNRILKRGGATRA